MGLMLLCLTDCPSDYKFPAQTSGYLDDMTLRNHKSQFCSLLGFIRGADASI